MDKKIIPVLVEDETLLPIYATSQAAGADLKAAIKEDVVLVSGASVLIPTGIFLQIPDGFEIQIRPRSGLALNHQITVLNTPGTIDADYRGEIKVILINHGKNSFVITPKMRIAQMVLAQVLKAEFVIAQKLSTTIREEKGFGHSGHKDKVNVEHS